MCLVVFSANLHPNYPLIIAANRDEFFDRPTEPVHHWRRNKDIIAGRDKVAGGTWLGISQQGRFSAVTNIRSFPQEPKDLSRGTLITNYLESSSSPIEFASQLVPTAAHYSGFNLFMGTIDPKTNIELSYLNNRAGNPLPLKSGIHGISNGLLSDNWRKVTHTQKRFVEALGKPFKREDLLQVLRHNERLEEKELPITGASIEFEQQLSSAFIPTFEIQGKAYGTRSQALITINQNLTCTYYEIQLNDQQQVVSENQFVFQIEH